MEAGTRLDRTLLADVILALGTLKYGFGLRRPTEDVGQVRTA